MKKPLMTLIAAAGIFAAFGANAQNTAATENNALESTAKALSKARAGKPAGRVAEQSNMENTNIHIRKSAKSRNLSNKNYARSKSKAPTGSFRVVNTSNVTLAAANNNYQAQRDDIEYVNNLGELPPLGEFNMLTMRPYALVKAPTLPCAPDYCPPRRAKRDRN